jgi:23S rRNA (cytidine1920-2'-O)/16S rRNA (cytidine1409-2'-O)-methyltransferase
MRKTPNRRLRHWLKKHLNQRAEVSITGSDTKIRADALLVNRGIALSRERAQSMIAAGHVMVAGVRLSKPAKKLSPTVEISVITPDMPWVSRGALKLIGGLDAFPAINPSGLHCVDIGASTGGFTEVLLARGAASVVAVDVGHGQLNPRIAGDQRVEPREGVNARNLVAADFVIPPQLIVCDASFISLTKVLPAVLELAAPGAFLMALLKPQFEVGRAEIGKGGIVRDDRVVRDVVARTQSWLAADMGWHWLGSSPSPIEGGDGNREFLMAGQKP